MAEHAPITTAPARRRRPHHTRRAAGHRRPVSRRGFIGLPLGDRAGMEALAALLIDALDQLDAPTADLEPEVLEEGDADEASSAPLTLTPDRAPVRCIRPGRRAAA